MTARIEWTCFVCGLTMNEKSKQKHLDSATHARNELANQQQQQQPQMQYYQEPQMQYLGLQEPQMQYYQDPQFQYYQEPQMQYFQEPQMQYYQDPQFQYYQEPQVQYFQEPQEQPLIDFSEEIPLIDFSDDDWETNNDYYDNDYQPSYEEVIAQQALYEDWDPNDNPYDLPQDIIDEIQEEALAEYRYNQIVSRLRERDARVQSQFIRNNERIFAHDQTYELVSSNATTGRIYNILTSNDGRNIWRYFDAIAQTCFSLIYEFHQTTRVMRFSISIDVQYWHTVEQRFIPYPLQSKSKVLITDNQMLDLYTQIYNELENRIHEKELQGSGFRFDRILTSELKIFKMRSLGHGTYLPTPCRSQYIRNVDNSKKDYWYNRCCRASILAKLFPADSHPYRTSNYDPYRNYLNFEGITEPVTLDQIPKLENQNQNISINIFKYKNISGKLSNTKREDLDIEGVYTSMKKINCDIHVVDLLLIEEADKRHFATIMDFNKFAVSQYIQNTNIHFATGDYENHERQ